MSDDTTERRALRVGLGAGLIAAAVAALSAPIGFDDFDLLDLPRYRSRPVPRVSHAEQQRRHRASKMAQLTDKPLPLKHMHSAARRRALAKDQP